jgi:hypothetical protein
MQDVNHAIANLRQVVGIPTIEFDAGGNLTLIFNGETPVNLARVDDKTIEVWTELTGVTADASTVRRLMEANHLGEGTGAARLALAPGKDMFVLCERIDVEPLSDTQFADRIVEFLKYATFWNSGEGGRALSGDSGAPSGFSPDDSMIRA